MTKKNEAWYIEERATLLAEDFLLKLGPAFLSKPDKGLKLDYIVFFQQPKKPLITIGVLVEATQKQIQEQISFYPIPARWILRSNIPVLLIVIDVKHNEVYFNWLQDELSSKYIIRSVQKLPQIALRKFTQDEMNKLQEEIADTARKVYWDKLLRVRNAVHHWLIKEYGSSNVMYNEPDTYEDVSPAFTVIKEDGSKLPVFFLFNLEPKDAILLQGYILNLFVNAEDPPKISMFIAVANSKSAAKNIAKTLAKENVRLSSLKIGVHITYLDEFGIICENWVI